MSSDTVQPVKKGTMSSSQSPLKIRENPVWKKRFAFTPTRVEIEGRKTIWHWFRKYEKYEQSYEGGHVLFRRSSHNTHEQNFFIMVFDYR